MKKVTPSLVVMACVLCLFAITQAIWPNADNAEVPHFVTDHGYQVYSLKVMYFPDNPCAMEDLSRYLHALGYYDTTGESSDILDSALYWGRQFLLATPNNAFARLNLAGIHTAIGNYDSAYAHAMICLATTGGKLEYIEEAYMRATEASVAGGIEVPADFHPHIKKFISYHKQLKETGEEHESSNCSLCSYVSGEDQGIQ